MGSEVIPNHIRETIEAILRQPTHISYGDIAKKYQVAKGTVANIKKRMDKRDGVPNEKPRITPEEKKRREKVSKAVATVHAIKKGEYIAEGFVNAFDVVSYIGKNMIEIIDRNKTEVEKIAENQKEIIDYFKGTFDETEEGKPSKSEFNLITKLYESIQMIKDFFNRDAIQVKANSELRKTLETFLRMKGEIMDIKTIKEMLDAFFNACNQLDNDTYIKYRDEVIADAPVTAGLFAKFETKCEEQKRQLLGNDGDIHQ
jgi:hypothetical protein